MQTSVDLDQICTKTSKDYAEYLDHELENRLRPVNKFIESILSRLEEFETLVAFTRNDIDESTNALISISEHYEELQILFSKIDTVEQAVNHIRTNLKNLEGEIEKAEHKLGLNNDKNIVSNILTPLFFMKPEKKTLDTTSPTFETRTYFDAESMDEINDT